uniref:FIIND domain-containing protein n=1 Tax=Astatotilapia calliptera TaxID=8154 RepID=A0AAX7VWF5_ASTCA
MNDDMKKYQSDFLLDLYSHLKDCKTKTGLSVLPSLQSVLQSAPTVWSINLSERKTSSLLEVLKLQPEKKQVELTGCSHEESEVRSFLQCLPYISQLSVDFEDPDEEIRFFVNLFCAAAEREQRTGEKILELLSSVCRFDTFPFVAIDDDLEKYQCDFLLDMCSHMKDYETKTGLSVLPSLQSVFSAPAVWSINLSERKTSILLEVLKLQPEKKQVELTGCSHEESEVRSFLQCLPYISQLSVDFEDPDEEIRFFENLFCAAAEREQQTGEKILELLSSVCTYQNFPFTNADMDDDLKKYQCDFLLDMCSHVKDCETKTGLSVLPSLQSVFQSAPAVWSINLSERKTSILLEVLKLQPEKKEVKLTVSSHEESEVRSFLQCLPYISQLSCDPDFFQRVCTSMSVRSREEAQQLESLLQLLGFQLLLTGELNRKSCWSVGRVLRLCGSKVDLILTPSKMSARGAALLFRHTTQLHSLRLSIDMVLLLFQWVRRGRVVCPLAVEELSLVPKKAQPSQRVMLRAVSSLASLLRHWTVGRLDLTESCIPAQGLITLLLHDGPLTVKLSEESFQQLLCLLHEIQDKDLTLSFFSKVGGDLTSCCLNWELLHYLLQQASAQTITVNLRKNLFLQEETTRLLPFLDRIVFKRPSPSFVMSSIRELYRAHDSHAVPSLLRSLGHVINLSCRELDSVDCAALIFILKHGDRVKLNLLWTSIPAEGAESILFMLDKVSHLSVDRNQLLRFIHCCAACDVQQEAASGLLRTLQHSLDLSCSSCVELPEEDQPEPLSLTADDCRAVSTILTHSSQDTQLDLRDCEVEDSVLDLLFPVLHRVRLRVSKTVLLQLLSLVPVNSERDTVRRAVSLCAALGGELDLSHSTLDQRACGSLVQMLDSCEGLTELDLSHCQLTDQLLLPLITHLHKVQVLDLSHNQITDASTDVLLQLLSINPSIDCVRLYSNNIMHRAAFKEHKQFEICLSHNQITDASTDVLLQLLSINPSIDCVRSEEEQTKELEVEMLEIQAAASSIDDSEVKPGPNTPDINPKDVKKLPSSFIPEVKNECAQIFYRFKCPGSGLFHCILTGLVFDMTREAELLYKIIQWDESVLQPAGKMAAGPLFDIKCCEDAVRQLHFPHCVKTQEALLSDGLLSVAHFTDDAMSFIKPLKITDTHVIVDNPHLSAFGLVLDFLMGIWNKQVKGQVLLFLSPPNHAKQTQNINVLLLPRNIPMTEVSKHHQPSHFILVPSACNLIKNTTYTVHCPVANKIQPKRAEFDMEFGPNYSPTFVIRLPMNTDEVTLTIRDQTDTEVWEHEADLTDHLPFSADGRIPAEKIMVMLLDILEDLNDEEFKKFKWHLKTEVWNNISPIKENYLSKADRNDTVDLMVQTYEITGAVQVMENILKTICRNDLVKKLSTLRH